MMVIDLHVFAVSGATAVNDRLVLDALRDVVKLGVTDDDGIVAGLEVLGVVEVQTEVVVNLDRGKVTPRPLVLEAP